MRNAVTVSVDRRNTRRATVAQGRINLGQDTKVGDRMPYVTKARRKLLAKDGFTHISVAGDLNYQITKLCLEYMVTKGLCYQVCNDIVGALDGAKTEFQRRVVGPYEDKAIERNGDVFPQWLILVFALSCQVDFRTGHRGLPGLHGALLFGARYNNIEV